MATKPKPTTKTFFLTRDADNEPQNVYLWEEKPDVDPQGNYFIKDLNTCEEDTKNFDRTCATVREWEQAFDTRIKKGTMVKVTLEISQAETALQRAKTAIESKNTTKAELVDILIDLVGNEPDTSDDDILEELDCDRW